jgi:hypothetical protein
MSNLANALSTIESEFKNKDSIIMAKTNALDQTVKHLYDLRLHIESQLKRKVQDAQIVTEILAKLVPLTKDGPGT